MDECQPSNSENEYLSSFSVVIPAFNEEMAIEDTLRKLTANQLLSNAEIIVVNDGSKDNTAFIIKKFKQVKLINHLENKGYGAALVTGMQNSTKDFIVWMDSDGQHRVEDLLSVMKRIIKDDLDYCIGIRNASSYQEPTRIFGKWILRRAVRMVSGGSITDFNSGLRGFRRSVIRKYLHLLPKGFGASTTTSLIMREQAYKGGEVPITVLRRIGKSSVKQFRDGMRTLNLILRIFLIFKPLRFFGGIGIVMILSGLTYGLIKAGTTGKGFPVLAAVVLLSGLQTMFMGLIMDHISAMRRERFD